MDKLLNLISHPVFAALDPGGGGGNGGTAGFSTPKSWLSGDLGSGLPAARGLPFFTNRVVPFLTSAALFLVIALSLIFLVWGGILWITSGGNKEGAAKAKNTVTYAIIGLVLGLLSFAFLSLLGQFLNIPLLGPGVTKCGPGQEC